jgi:hypothetical protein
MESGKGTMIGTVEETKRIPKTETLQLSEKEHWEAKGRSFSRRAERKFLARVRHRIAVQKNQATEILRADGTLANLENRCVIKAIRLNPTLRVTVQK